MKLHIIWDKEQIRYSSYLPKYATHTFLIPNFNEILKMERYNFLHIPKTGGSTLRMNIKNQKVDFTIDMNHETKYKKGNRNITFIRHPINRTISHFSEMNNNTKEGLSFKNWFDERYFNFQTKWLLNQVLNTTLLTKGTFNWLKNVLSDFYFIGTTENLETDLNVLFKKMGVERIYPNTNITKLRYEPSKEEKKLILSKNDYDLKLYEFAKKWRII